MIAVNKRALHDCFKGKPRIRGLRNGLQLAYNDLKPPIDSNSWLRPTIPVLYLVIAARFLMGAVGRLKAVVFGAFGRAARQGANYLSLKAYFEWNFENSDCREKQLGEIAMDRLAGRL